jgi:hypothetical protein
MQLAAKTAHRGAVSVHKPAGIEEWQVGSRTHHREDARVHLGES